MNMLSLSSHPLRWLLLDLNSYFASCEAQDQPALRGVPLAVVPVMTEKTCAIAASTEAKAFGIKTGTPIWEAKRLCPSLRLVQARPRLYVTYHHAILEAIETCIPIEKVLSIDEVACRLDKVQREPSAAIALAMALKKAISSRVGACMTCSIGIAPNKLLAKLASDMQKPDGLVLLAGDDLPKKILHLGVQDICGIGANMAARLARCGITDMPGLWEASPQTLRRAWNGVAGVRFHALLHGADLPDQDTKRRSLGHQHVLAPEDRTYLQASTVLRALLVRAAQRLRDEGFYAKRLVVDVLWAGNLGYHADDIAFPETQDTRFFLGVLDRLWQAAPRLKPLRVGVTLADLVQAQAHQLDLFDDPQKTTITTPEPKEFKKTSPQLNAVLDQLNGKYGRGTVSFASAAPDFKNEKKNTSAPTGSELVAKIAFQRVPRLKEF